MLGCSREKEARRCVYKYKEIIIKELAHTGMGTEKSKTCRVHWLAGDPEKSPRYSSSLLQNSLLFREVSLLFFRASQARN